jgi:hypothetical protein
MDIQNLFNYATTALECAAMLTFSKCVLRISDKKIFLYIALVSVICGSLVKLQVDLFDYETLTIPLQLLLQVFVNVMLFGVA